MIKPPTITLRLKTPIVPNFLKIEGTDASVPICEIPPDVLDAVVQRWRAALHARAAEQAKERAAAER